MSETPISQEAITQPAELNFIFWSHVEENVPELLEVLDPYDVIFLESSPNGPKRQKLIAEAIINKFLGGELSRQHQGVLNYEYGEAADLFTYGNMRKLVEKNLSGEERGIVERYHDSGKTVRFLDTNPKDNPDVVELVGRASEVRARMNLSAHRREKSSVDQNMSDLEELIGLRAAADVIREGVIEKQLDNLLPQYPNKRIAVVYGSSHTAISFKYLDAGMARRMFLNEDSAGGVKKIHDVTNEAVRSLRFGKPLPKKLLQRILFRSSVLAELLAMKSEQDVLDMLDKMDNFDPDSMKKTDIAGRLAREISDEQLDEFVVYLDEVLHGFQPGDLARLHQFLQDFI